jgi:hypothetical protein
MHMIGGDEGSPLICPLSRNCPRSRPDTRYVLRGIVAWYQRNTVPSEVRATPGIADAGSNRLSSGSPESKPVSDRASASAASSSDSRSFSGSVRLHFSFHEAEARAQRIAVEPSETTS